MYTMMGTSADLAFVVSIVSQFMLKASPLHWMVMKRIMRSLKEALDFKLCNGGNAIALKGYCDADWAWNANERLSTMGYVFFVGVGIIL